MSPELAAFLERHSAGIQDALSHGDAGVTLDHVRSYFEAEQAWAWELNQSGLIARLHRVDITGDVEVLVWLAWGAMDDIIALETQVEEWARSVTPRVARIVFIGRLGWLRSAPVRERGYTPRHVAFSKEL